jgi:hypothetical protein
MYKTHPSGISSIFNFVLYEFGSKILQAIDSATLDFVIYRRP